MYLKISMYFSLTGHHHLHKISHWFHWPFSTELNFSLNQIYTTSVDLIQNFLLAPFCLNTFHLFEGHKKHVQFTNFNFQITFLFQVSGTFGPLTPYLHCHISTFQSRRPQEKTLFLYLSFTHKRTHKRTHTHTHTHTHKGQSLNLL